MNLLLILTLLTTTLDLTLSLEKFTLADAKVSHPKVESNNRRTSDPTIRQEAKVKEKVSVESESEEEEKLFLIDSLIPDDPVNRFLIGFSALALFTQSVLRPFGQVTVKRKRKR